ncbi:MAG TPA: ABC transporter ATP-binding protein [Clostridia bacterium]|nr:ABC transporter ATP-binding protein [Clostridia bacterium]
MKISPECKKQFMYKNRMNFWFTISMVFIDSGVAICIAFIIKSITEAMETTDFGKLRQAILLTAIATAANFFVGFMQKKYRNRYLKKALLQFKMFIFEKLLKKSINEFGNTTTGTFISAFSNDLVSVETHYLAGNIGLVTNISLLVGGIVAMAYINWILMLCVVAASILPCAISLKYGTKITAREKQTSIRNAGFVEQIKDLLNGFIVIKSFKAENEALQIFESENISVEEAKRKRRETNDTVSILGDISFIVITVLIVAVGTFFVFKSVMTIGGVIAFVELSSTVLNPIKRLVPLWSNRKSAIAIINRIADFVEIEHEAEEKAMISEFNDSIVVKNVKFEYETGKTVLNTINQTFEKGKSYAIVGNSGGGKSTLLSLLMGHFSTYEGNILFDDKELRDISLDSLYDIVSVIQQNVFLFDSSIKNNITMFKDFPEEKYNAAVKNAGLSDLIEKKGNDYACGSSGCNLSGGEKQRVSIARCLIRETPVLLMDEATASLDNATATEVTNSILNIDGLTRIIVTHKLEESTMEKYDEIIVVNNGDIVERGGYTELMGMKKYFYSLFNVLQ